MHRARRLFGPMCVVLALSSLLAPAKSASAQSWWDAEWQCRRTITVKKHKRRPGEEAAHVRFSTGGFLRPDGGDLRVFGKRKIVPYKIVSVGPGDKVSLLFKVLKGCDEYHIYYGNAAAEPLEFDWTPQRGLVMETRRYEGGENRNWGEMRATMKRAKHVYGRGLVEKIWHGHNPFGPSRNMVSIYRGWLQIPAQGEYDFVTSSASASFLFVDDKPAVQWPGWHRAVPDGRFRKRITLTAGLHQFAYYHVQGDADPIMVAAWRPPQSDKIEVIPPHAFLPPLKCTPIKYHINGQTSAADFVWRNAAEAHLDERHFVTMQFACTSFPRTSRATRREWHFGDGVTSKEYRPRHIYLATGTYPVTLKVFRGEHISVCRQKVVVARNWARQHLLQPDSLEDVAGEIDQYPFEKMTAPVLCGAVLLYEKLGRAQEMLRIGKLLAGKLRELSDEDLVAVAVSLGAAWRDKGHSAENALKLFREVEAELKNSEFKARIAVLAGDTLLDYMRKPASAKAEYLRVLRDYPKAATYVRLATIRLGDVARRLGKIEEARRYYEQSLEGRPKRAPGREAMDAALCALEAEDLLRRGELEAAEKALHLWQWQAPMAKLQGHWSALMARLAVKRREWEEVIKETETLLRVNPESQYAPELLLLLARAQTERGAPAKAREALERARGEYPDSPLMEKIEQALRALDADGPRP